MWNPRQFYTPLQPAARTGSNKIVYSEILPDAALQSLIYCYWELKTSRRLREQYQYKVVTDGCIDIFFDMENPQESCVMGFCKNYTEFPLKNSFHYVGVRFFPAIFPLLFKVNASELSNRVELLENIDAGISNFISIAFKPWQTSNDIKSNFDLYFLKHLRKNRLEPDKRIENAVQLILRNRGLLRIEKEIDTGLSPRQLRRLFNYYIGDTAKVFSKVVRFQKILRNNTVAKNMPSGFFDAGDFFDQSHFIKDFKDFYGTTPGQVLKR